MYKLTVQIGGSGNTVYRFGTRCGINKWIRENPPRLMYERNEALFERGDDVTYKIENEQGQVLRWLAWTKYDEQMKDVRCCEQSTDCTLI